MVKFGEIGVQTFNFHHIVFPGKRRYRENPFRENSSSAFKLKNKTIMKLLVPP